MLEHAQFMRVTVTLNDSIAIEAKRQAVARGLSLSQLVNEALRHEVAGCLVKTTQTKFTMPVFGNPSSLIDSSPVDFHNILFSE